MLYEFTKLYLQKCEFENLVFMGPSRSWTEPPPEKDTKFLVSLGYQPLKEVVKKVIERSGLKGQNPTPTEVFESIDVIARGDTEPWFKTHARLSRCFNKGLMDKLWIRNLASHERASAQNGSFYTEDGNHRALVYALYIELTEMDYEPVEAIHATSWDIASGILGHSVQPASVLENDGKLEGNKHRKEKFSLPIGIDIQMCRR